MRHSLLPLLAMAASMGPDPWQEHEERRAKRAAMHDFLTGRGDRIVRYPSEKLGAPVSAAEECLRIVQEHGTRLRHRITGEVRDVQVWTSDSSVWFTIGTRQVHRKARKALDWLRHAEAAGGAS